MLPALTIFKGKRQLKFSTPLAVKTTVQGKAWMDEDVMKRWFKGVIVPYTKVRSLLIMDAFSAHETEDIFDLAKSHIVDLAIIPGGCTSKVQPLDVCLNKPFKDVLRKKWIEFMALQVSPSKL